MDDLTVEEKNNLTEVATVENNHWTSKKELMDICQCSKTTLEQIINELNCQTDLAIKNHIRKGGYRNLQVFYDDELVKMIQAKLMTNQANQGRGSDIVKEATAKAVEKDLVITEIIKSGNSEAFEQLMNQYKLAFDTAQQNRLLLEQNQQMAHALDYTSVIGWKKWSELKKELAQDIELFQHRISFKTVAAEADLVKGVDYKELIFGEDCYPTTLISPAGEDKIYDRYDI